MKTNLTLLIFVFFIACSTPSSEDQVVKPVKVEIQTTLGAITLELSDKTPLHRDNFIKLVEQGVYDSTIFHRVIDGFVVQAGEKDSTASDNLDMDYTVPAEFDTSLFHRRGALGAARDGNPERASSAIQFYIVQRGPRVDSLIDKDESRINTWLSNHYTLNAPENQSLKDSILKVIEDENWEAYSQINDSIASLAESMVFEEYKIPKAHRATYNATGGAPHLDQNYTVFGQVITGMNVVDSIASQPVGEQNRPLESILILKAKILED